jgi:hypothetical protein
MIMVAPSSASVTQGHAAHQAAGEPGKTGRAFLGKGGIEYFEQENEH